jgi:hypothetical protein
MRYALPVSVLLAIGLSVYAIGAERPLRLAQIQDSTACISNCNTQSALCTNQCPVSGTLSQSQPDINAGQVITQNRIDLLQNAQPIQCRLNCTSQQQACYATCR